MSVIRQKKYLLISILLITAVGAAVYYQLKPGETPFVEQLPNDTYITEEESQNSDSNTSSEKDTSLKISVNENIGAGEMSVWSDPPLRTIVNEKTKKWYSFKEIPELAGATGNYVWKLQESDPESQTSRYLIEEVGFAGVGLLSFSPDNKYFAFRTRWLLGAGEFVFNIHVVNLETGDAIIVHPPRQPEEEVTTISLAYMETYEWAVNALNIVFYTVKLTDEGYLRTANKQLWRYDLESGEYTFLREIEE